MEDDSLFNLVVSDDNYTPASFKMSTEPSSGETLVQIKARELSEASFEKAERLKTQQKERDAESVVSQWGLNPDSAAGVATNLGASLYSGVSRMVGSVAAAPTSYWAAVNQGSLTEPEITALGRYEQGDRTPETLAIVNRKTANIQNYTTRNPEEKLKLDAYNMRVQDQAN